MSQGFALYAHEIVASGPQARIRHASPGEQAQYVAMLVEEIEDRYTWQVTGRNVPLEGGTHPLVEFPNPTKPHGQLRDEVLALAAEVYEGWIEMQATRP